MVNDKQINKIAIVIIIISLILIGLTIFINKINIINQKCNSNSIGNKWNETTIKNNDFGAKRITIRECKCEGSEISYYSICKIMNDYITNYPNNNYPLDFYERIQISSESQITGKLFNKFDTTLNVIPIIECYQDNNKLQFNLTTVSYPQPIIVKSREIQQFIITFKINVNELGNYNCQLNIIDYYNHSMKYENKSVKIELY